MTENHNFEAVKPDQTKSRGQQDKGYLKSGRGDLIRLIQAPWVLPIQTKHPRNLEGMDTNSVLIR